METFETQLTQAAQLLQTRMQRHLDNVGAAGQTLADHLSFKARAALTSAFVAEK